MNILHHMSYQTEIEKLTALVSSEFKRLSTLFCEHSVDMIQIQEQFKSINLRLDVFASNTPARVGATTGTTRRVPITSFWKQYYHKIMKDLKYEDIDESDLNKLGITREIIDYVRKHKSNNKKTTTERLETEGGHVWRELSIRVKKEKENTESTDNTWTRVKENIEDLRNSHKVLAEKNEFVPLQPEVVTHTTTKPDNTSSKPDNTETKPENNTDDIINTDDF